MHHPHTICLRNSQDQEGDGPRSSQPRRSHHHDCIYFTTQMIMGQMHTVGATITDEETAPEPIHVKLKI